MRAVALGLAGLLAATAPVLAQTPQTLAASGVQPAASAPMPVANPLDIHTLRDLAGACSLRNDNPYYIAATSMCAGYTAAVIDFHLLDTMGPRHDKRKVCLPSPVPTRREAVAGLVAWVQSNPQYLDEPAASAVLRYFINVYPCHRKTFQWSPPGPMQ